MFLLLGLFTIANLSSPTFGTLLNLTPEEVVIQPLDQNGTVPLITLRFHFPRLGFVIRSAEQAKL
jgi:hypothetical protein